MPRLAVNQVFHGDCRSILATLPEDSVSCCITDPPYNYEIIGRQWDHAEISRRIGRVQDSSTLVKNIPYGSGLAGGVRNKRWYERNRLNALEYRNWCTEWGRGVFRVCRPGAVVAVFSSTRTFAQVQIALEEAGFYSRDCLVYRRNSGIPKGLNLKKKLEKINRADAADWDGWHTCFRSEWEAIAVLQKPLMNNYIETSEKTGLGPFKTINADGSFQSNILEGFAKGSDESFDLHCTIKPLALMKRMIELFVPPRRDHVVLDPFAGSGTTLLAAKQMGYSFLGIEIERAYIPLINHRLAQAESRRSSFLSGGAI